MVQSTAGPYQEVKRNNLCSPSTREYDGAASSAQRTLTLERTANNGATQLSPRCHFEG